MSRYMVGVFALRADRPGEALRGRTKRDRQSLLWRTWSWTWQIPTEAYHLLGNHQQELREARRGREQHPDLLVTIARRISQRLGAIARPYLFGHSTLWRAKIAALLGDREGAVVFLREAISQGLMPLDLAQGLGYTMWLHRDIDFESLRDYLPFQELLQPKA